MTTETQPASYVRLSSLIRNQTGTGSTKVGKMWPCQTIVIGGARSGKSTFAERLVRFYGKSKIYIATAQTADSEMSDRIDRHRQQRGADWHTIESPLDLTSVLAGADSDQAILIDCLTLWLSNHLCAGTDIETESDRLLTAIANCDAKVVVVSNEVGQGIVPENALARRFRDAQGRLNQRLAAQCQLAVLIAAGLPLVLKGALPRGFE